MANPRILQALRSGDPDERKKAVTALGRSLDPEVLPILAKVYRNDPDDGVREMARKAGAYIRRNKHNFTPDTASDAPAPAPKTTAALLQPEPESAAAERQTHPLLEVDLSTVKVSGANAERAKVAVDQAMSYDVKGEQARAMLALRKAFELDPRLREDEYTRGLTLQIANGANENDAIYRVLTMDAEMVKQAKTSGESGASRLMAFIMMIGGVLMLAGFFLPWLTFADDGVMSLDGASLDSPSGYSGLDIFNDTDGIAITLSQIALFNDMMRGNFSMVNPSRNPVTYSPALTAAAGGLLLLFGVMGALGGAGKRSFWILGGVLTLAGAAAPVWFYVTVTDFVEMLSVFMFGMVEVSFGELSDIGFFMTVGGVVVGLLGAVLGIVTVVNDG